MAIVEHLGSHQKVIVTQGARHTFGANVALDGALIEEGDTTAVVPDTDEEIDTASSVVVADPAGAITGVILTPGTVDKQPFTLVNISGNSITAAAAGTSNVANGTSCVVAAVTAARFIWIAAEELWFRV